MATESDVPDSARRGGAVPFVHLHDVEWSTVVNRWEWVRRGEHHVKADLCPRCGHPMTITHEAESRRAAFAVLPDVSPLLVSCNCEIPHPGAPEVEEGNLGCGFHGHISRPPFRL